MNEACQLMAIISVIVLSAVWALIGLIRCAERRAKLRAQEYAAEDARRKIEDARREYESKTNGRTVSAELMLAALWVVREELLLARDGRSPRDPRIPKILHEMSLAFTKSDSGEVWLDGFRAQYVVELARKITKERDGEISE